MERPLNYKERKRGSGSLSLLAAILTLSKLTATN